MIYGVIGPRDFGGKEYENYAYVEQALNTFTDMEKMISGGSKGVERLAEKWATDTDIEFDVIRPNINLHGAKSAFHIRNTEILKASNALIVFWDGTTPGIIDVLAHAMKIEKEVSLLPMI